MAVGITMSSLRTTAQPLKSQPRASVHRGSVKTRRHSPLRVCAAATGIAAPASQPDALPDQLPRDVAALRRWFRRRVGSKGAAEEEATALEAEPAATAAQQPILSFAGGGIFFWWMLGCLRYLHRNFDLSKVQLVGASAGGLIATLAACGVNEDKAVRVAHRLAEEYGVYDRPAGLAGIWGSLIRDWLEELLPADAAERCAGRVRLVVTEVPSLRIRYLENFESKQDLIDANMASVHIPFFLDGNPTRSYRGRAYIDGSLWDFVMSGNSKLITCEGQACVIDYFDDDQLGRNRLDFIKLANLEQVQAFVQSGYAFAERTDAAGDGFEGKLGITRKGRVRKALEVPVWGLRSALASVDG